MRNYYIFKENGQTWVYLLGTLISSNEIQTIDNYEIKNIKLNYHKWINNNLEEPETLSYNVFVIGVLEYKENNLDVNCLRNGDSIIVSAILDQSDITQKGYVVLNKNLDVCGFQGKIPKAFIYLPLSSSMELVSEEILNQKNPYFILNNEKKKKIDCNFSYEIIYGKEKKKVYVNDKNVEINVILKNANGYDKESPAFFIETEPVTVKPSINKKTTVINFIGSQICKR